MAIRSYIITENVKSPYVQVTGMPHKPQAIKFKQFRKGEIVKGELKHSNNQPAFLLVDGCCVVPLGCLREVVTKEITSNAVGDKQDSPAPTTTMGKLIAKTPAVNYIDSAIIGGLLGLGAVYLAEKQGWLPVVDKKNKIYGALIGSAVALYGYYRFKPKFKKTEKKD
mgnify:CR=1 FL=1|tara:strand:- start:464 stop:964 length:501 start_codon:yes stop_codon:yes gene_type:complete